MARGLPAADYPLLATYPDIAAPRILQQKEQLLWLDARGKPTLEYNFADWLK